ncbi:MAG TPA: hypothetical protein DEO70_12040 [Bacteroidales bacterium]|nr:MAG: hypothetical protein A2X11_10030 [Bacteroidetes bacterium GWE2_42_24]OFY25850.1 MAG: hypothetical protein A2X09_09405 [Bacteroidetes bacterium GWF2_43_11]HBZ67558.1 hypothetical protein [Bacteroidales bacterium]
MILDKFSTPDLRIFVEAYDLYKSRLTDRWLTNPFDKKIAERVHRCNEVLTVAKTTLKCREEEQ